MDVVKRLRSEEPVGKRSCFATPIYLQFHFGTNPTIYKLQVLDNGEGNGKKRMKPAIFIAKKLVGCSNEVIGLSVYEEQAQANAHQS